MDMSTNKQGNSTKQDQANKPDTEIDQPKLVKRNIVQSQDATTLLTADHKRINGLFAEYEKSRSNVKKKAIVAQLCTELAVHTQIEEEIFYPAIQAALKEKQLIPEALIEHAVLKSLINQVENREPDGDMFDARIKVLSEYVKHHVREEHANIFPKARANWIDLMELGARMARRKVVLLAQRNTAEPADSEKPDLFAMLPSVGLGGRAAPDLRQKDRRASRSNGVSHITR